MKKRMPKLMALVLTLVLCLGSVQSVFAANTYNDADGKPIVSENVAEDVTVTFHKDVVAGKYKLVDTKELKSWVDKNEKMVVVDTMPAAKSYNIQHVPGAINSEAGTGTGDKAYNFTDEQKKAFLKKVNAALPTTTYTDWSKVSKSTYNKLKKSNRKTAKVNGKTVYYKKVVKKGPNKKYKIVVYCGFVGCARSHVAAKYLVDNGYTNVYRYGGGIQAWVDAGNEAETHLYVNAKYVNSKVNDSKSVILDVRAKKDYAEGHVPGAASASVLSAVTGATEDGVAADNIKAAVEKYGKDKEYILICYSGNKYANAASDLLLGEGVEFSNIKILGGDDNKQSGEGGMKAWEKSYAKVTDNTVSIKCAVKQKDKPVEHWFIVSKGGKVEESTVLTTNVSTTDFYNTLAALTSKKMWNTGAVKSFADGVTLDQLVKEGKGSADYAKFDVTVSWGGKDYKLSDVITNAKHDSIGGDYNGDYQVAFAGNLANQNNAKTGCITCFGGCYMGITSGHDTPMMIEYDPANLPAVGETVTVTYTLK